MTIKIEKEKLLLVEGKDERCIIEKYLSINSISDIQVIDCGGKEKLKEQFPIIIKTPGFSDVISYGIIQDADSDSNATFQSIKSTLFNNGQPTPTKPEIFHLAGGVRVGVYICAGQGTTGMLEDIFLGTLAKTELLRLADQYVTDLTREYPNTSAKGVFGVSNNKSKLLVQSVLVATSRPCNSLGLAAQQGYIDFNHPAMASIIKFINSV